MKPYSKTISDIIGFILLLVVAAGMGYIFWTYVFQ